MCLPRELSIISGKDESISVMIAFLNTSAGAEMCKSWKLLLYLPPRVHMQNRCWAVEPDVWRGWRIAEFKAIK